MSQTTLSLLALSLAMLLSISQLQWSLQTKNRIIDDEMEVMASGVARRIIEFAASRSFDERTTPERWNEWGEPISVLDFNPSFNFGNYPDCDLENPWISNSRCDDIDDLHMDSTSWQTVSFSSNGDTLFFEANVQVYYVADNNLEQRLYGYDRSMNKEISVRVRSPFHTLQHRNNIGLVNLRRVFSYNVADEEARAERALKEEDETGTGHVNDY